MDIRRMAAMTERVAAGKGDVDEALNAVDEGIDIIISAIELISENLPKVMTNTPEETSAKESIQEILDTAVAPYTADIIEKLEIFEKEEK